MTFEFMKHIHVKPSAFSFIVAAAFGWLLHYLIYTSTINPFRKLFIIAAFLLLIVLSCMNETEEEAER